MLWRHAGLQMLQLEESWTWGLYLGLAEAQACLQLVPAAVTDIRLSSRGELVDDLAWARLALSFLNFHWENLSGPSEQGIRNCSS